jgi:hypothetical protein
MSNGHIAHRLTLLCQSVGLHPLAWTWLSVREFSAAIRILRKERMS